MTIVFEMDKNYNNLKIKLISKLRIPNTCQLKELSILQVVKVVCILFIKMSDLGLELKPVLSVKEKVSKKQKE